VVIGHVHELDFRTIIQVSYPPEKRCPNSTAGGWAIEKPESLSGPTDNLGACHLGQENEA
jgi:hypothetical protein